MVDIQDEGSYTRILYTVPTRGLLGYRSEFINDTRGEGTMVRRLAGYEAYKGDIPRRANGALISTETGKAMTYALWNIQERGQLFVSPQTEVYEGMIIGMAARNMDMDVNPLKNKKDDGCAFHRQRRGDEAGSAEDHVAGRSAGIHQRR